MTREREAVDWGSLRRKFRDKVPSGGRAVGRTEGEERSERSKSSAASLSGGEKAVERYSIRPSGMPGTSDGVGSDGGSILITWIAGTMTSVSSSPGWDADGKLAVERIPRRVWKVAGLNVASSSYTYDFISCDVRVGRDEP